jgi:hypothetical protein
MIQVGTGKNIKYFPIELMRVAPRQPHRGQVDENMQVINFQDFLG